jgi:hypothetical protein
MKLEAIRLTKAQQCEIIAKLSKPNTLSKRALGQEYKVSEGTILKVWDNWENILQRMALMINDAKTPKRKLNKCMMNCDDRLRHFSKTLTN